MNKEEVTITEESFLRIAPDDMKMLAKMIGEEITAAFIKVRDRQDQLLNMKELSKEMNIPYSRLFRIPGLPYYCGGRKGRKMYKIREVEHYLKTRR